MVNDREVACVMSFADCILIQQILHGNGFEAGIFSIHISHHEEYYRIRFFFVSKDEAQKFKTAFENGRLSPFKQYLLLDSL